MNRELLLLVDALAREKNVPKDTVFVRARVGARLGDQEALQGEERRARRRSTASTGDYESFRRWQVVPDDEHRGPGLPDRRDRRRRSATPNSQLGDYIEEPLEPIEFGRIGAQAAKQVILQKIRDAEREQILNDFLARGRPARHRHVKRIERGNAIIESGRIEGVLPRDQMIPKENLRVGDRVRAYMVQDRPQRARARSSSCRAPRPSSSSGCSSSKCRRSRKACSRSRRRRATRACAPRSR